MVTTAQPPRSMGDFDRSPQTTATRFRFQAAGLAFDHQKTFFGGVIQPVAGAEERADTGLPAAGALHSQIACSVNSFSGIRCARIRALTSRGESFLMRFTLRRFASILGSS